MVSRISSGRILLKQNFGNNNNNNVNYDNNTCSILLYY